MMWRSFEDDINEISKNNLTNNKTSLKSTVHTYISITDLIFCGSSTNDSIKSSVLKKIKSQNDCTFLFFNKHKIAYVLWTFHFMKIAKMFWQNQKIVLKINTFIYLFQWICVAYLKLFRKLIFFWSDYEPPSMRTLVEATTEREVKSVKKQLKTKKRLFKMFQRNKKQKSEDFLNETSKTTRIVIKKNDMYHQNFWEKNCFSDIITIHMQIILIKSKL